MEAVKNYLDRNSEQVFILLILGSTVGISYLIPYKLVSLNFYFLLILLGTIYLGVHKAVLGGVFCSLLVGVHVYYLPGSFMPAFSDLDLWMNILAWSSFLILTGGVVGKLTDNLKIKIEKLKRVNGELENHVRELEQWASRFTDLS